MVEILGKKWYHFLVKREGRRGSLEEAIGDLSSKLLIHTNIEGLRLFTSFNTLTEFVDYQSRFHPRQRNFFETIRGQPQKVYFDIDIKRGDLEEGEDLDAVSVRLLGSVITALIKTLDIEAKDICLFQSNGQNKRSYHIVTHKHYVASNEHNKQVFLNIVKEIPNDLSRFLDHSMYSSIQQFRVMGSQKPGTNRPKKLVSEWVYKGEKIELGLPGAIRSNDRMSLIYMFGLSMITYIEGCTLIPIQLVAKERHHEYKERANDSEIVLTKRDVKEIVSRVDRSVFHLREVVGNIVCFGRNRPSMCVICNRRHDSEKPYVVVSEDGTIRFFCRRAPKFQFKYLGMLSRFVKEKFNDPIEMKASKSVLSLVREASGENRKVFTPMSSLV